MRRNHAMALVIFGVASAIAAVAVLQTEYGTFGALAVVAASLTVIALVIGNLPDLPGR